VVRVHSPFCAASVYVLVPAGVLFVFCCPRTSNLFIVSFVAALLASGGLAGVDDLLPGVVGAWGCGVLHRRGFFIMRVGGKAAADPAGSCFFL